MYTKSDRSSCWRFYHATHRIYITNESDVITMSAAKGLLVGTRMLHSVLSRGHHPKGTLRVRCLYPEPVEGSGFDRLNHSLPHPKGALRM